jgi:hypothetical protein
VKERALRRCFGRGSECGEDVGRRKGCGSDGGEGRSVEEIYEVKKKCAEER